MHLGCHFANETKGTDGTRDLFPFQASNIDDDKKINYIIVVSDK